MTHKKNEIKVTASSPTQGLQISSISTRQVIDATNNRAQYYSDLAKKYRDEAKQHRDNAKYYSEQNSDVTVEYIDSVKAELIRKIDAQDAQLEVKLEDEVIQKIPKDVSELNNDVPYLSLDDFEKTVKELELPTQKNCEGMFLTTDGNNEYWKPISTGLALYDTILKDHILTYEESKGLALQGTYVYKDAVAGSRYGYPDFYNKVVEEYQNSSNGQVYVKPNVDKVGLVIENNGVLSGFSDTDYAILPNAMPTDSNDWDIVIKYNTGVDVVSTTNQAIFGCASTNYRVLIGIVGSKFVLYLSSNGTAWNLANGLKGSYTVLVETDYYIKFSRINGEKYVLSYSTDGLNFSDEITVTNTAQMVSDIYCLGRTSATGQKAKGLVNLKETYININGERWWDGAEYLHCKKNSNGHIFYDIAEKGKVDEIFASIGAAWFYGVDTENERVFLPRKSLLELTTESKIPVIGNGNGLGLSTNANDTSKYFPIAERDGDDSEIFTHTARTSAIAMGTSIGNATGGVANGLAIGVSTNPNFSGLTTDLTSVLAQQTEKYLYICVGNTTNYKGVTDVVNQGIDILAQVNQGLESRVSLDGSNAIFPYIIETYQNGTSWYRIWSDGWCEQGGTIKSGVILNTVNLLKPYKDITYTVSAVAGHPTLTNYGSNVSICARTTTSFSCEYWTYNWGAPTGYECMWQACGYIA